MHPRRDVRGVVGQNQPARPDERQKLVEVVQVAILVRVDKDNINRPFESLDGLMQDTSKSWKTWSIWLSHSEKTSASTSFSLP